MVVRGAAGLAAALSAGAAAYWLVRRRGEGRRRRRLVVCWVSVRLPEASALSRLERAVASWCSLVVISGKELGEVPASADVVIAGDPESYADEAESVRWLASSGVAAVVIPYAGVFPSIRARCAAANEARARAGRRPLLLANCHHNAPMTAELAVSLALSAAKRVARGDRELRAGDWRGRGLGGLAGAPDPVPVIPQLILDSNAALVVGLGAVGSRVAVALASLGCEVVATSRSARRVETRRLDAVRGVVATITVHPAASLERLLADAAIVVLCLPLSPETKSLFGQAEFDAMRPDAVLVNVARGPVVDQAALIEAIDQRKIASYASDVWYHYPADWAQAASCAPCRDADGRAVDLPPDLTLLSPHRGGAIGIPEVEDRRIDAIAAALRRAADLGVETGLATPPIGLVDIASGY